MLSPVLSRLQMGCAHFFPLRLHKMHKHFFGQNYPGAYVNGGSKLLKNLSVCCHLCSARKHSFTNPPNCSTLQPFLFTPYNRGRNQIRFSSHCMAKSHHTLEIKLCATMSMLHQLYRRRLFSLRRSSGEKLFLKHVKANR